MDDINMDIILLCFSSFLYGYHVYLSYGIGIDFMPFFVWLFICIYYRQKLLIDFFHIYMMHTGEKMFGVNCIGLLTFH